MTHTATQPVSILTRIKSIFVGKGSLTDFGERFLILDRDYQSSIKGMYAIGDVSGSPDIKAALNAGYRVGQRLGSLPRRTTAKIDYDVIIVGSGPAGLNTASELVKVGKKVLVLERKKRLQTIRSFADSKPLFLASTGDPKVLGDFPFEDCSAKECFESWEKVLESKPDIQINALEDVCEIRERGAFEVFTKTKSGDEKTYLADRIVVACGKPRNLARLELGNTGDGRIQYQTRYEGGVEDRDVLVVGHAGSYEGFEMALDLSPNNRVTLIYEEDGKPDIAQSVLDRVENAVSAGRITFYRNTMLKSVDKGTIVLEHRQRDAGPLEHFMDDSLKNVLKAETGQTTIPNDIIFTGKIVDRELPSTDLRQFGLNTERRMSPIRWTMLMILFSFFAFVYLGKSGKANFIPGVAKLISGMEDLFGGLRMYQIWTIVYSSAVVTFGFKAIYKYRTQYRDNKQANHQTKRLLSLMFFQVFFLAILPELILHNWRAYGLVLAWPLNLDPNSYGGFLGTSDS
ncbi:MAG: FAD-dependent oxidoreductase [Planctomycetota bacterium]|nr:FAD-dependent oxidoreductase [Planctomycetota bacterium]